uniref:Uncharacterized protein n=1 Tax=Aegilops tauschii subsp. strangulata TaxID=200361 RepID=A0A453NK83_AEGTS
HTQKTSISWRKGKEEAGGIPYSVHTQTKRSGRRQTLSLSTNGTVSSPFHHHRRLLVPEECQ